MYLSFGVQRRFACEHNSVALNAGVQHAAAPRGLIRDKLVFAKSVCPIGDDVAVAGAADGIYQDAIFDTKKKALPGVELPKRAKNKDFQQILGLLEVLFRYAIVWQVVTEVTGHAAY